MTPERETADFVLLVVGLALMGVGAGILACAIAAWWHQRSFRKAHQP